MATITDRLFSSFTGQVGDVVFSAGVGESDDPDMLAYFEADPDRYDVTDGYDEDPADDEDPAPADTGWLPPSKKG